MKIILLGTGTSQGVPVIGCDCPVCRSEDAKDQRLRSSVYIQTENLNLVIDAGPDFRQQMLRENIKIVDGIAITHDHKDHIGGIDDVRAFNWILQRPMKIYANAGSVQTIMKDYSYAFEEVRYPGVPAIELTEIDKNPFLIKSEMVIPIHALHGHLPVLGFRIGNFSYLTDASYIDNQELDKMKGSKVIVINGLRHKKHHSHFNLDEATDILQYLNPQKGIITHISHQMGFQREINARLPNGIELGFDGMKFSITE